MKSLFRFIISIFIVILGLCVLDICIDKVLFNLLSNLPNDGSETSRTYYSLNKVDSPVLIVGSSRASHHYNSQMIEDSLNMKTYNVGRDGCFLKYNCCVNQSIMNRYTPEIIIWECGEYDLFYDENNKLQSLYPYYKKNDVVTKIINESESSKRKIQLQSNLYKYNSVALKILLRSALKSRKEDSLKGYLPLKPVNLKKELQLKIDSVYQAEIDTIRVECLKETIQQIKANGTKLFVAFSPIYRMVDMNQQNLSMDIMREICNKYDVPILDNRQLPEFLEHPEYFKDVTHLNSIGAEKYTEIVIEQIRKNL